MEPINAYIGDYQQTPLAQLWGILKTDPLIAVGIFFLIVWLALGVYMFFAYKQNVYKKGEK